MSYSETNNQAKISKRGNGKSGPFDTDAVPENQRLMTRNVNGKLLRRGYTTGSCAAAAAKAAAILLLTGKKPETVTLDTPKGVRLSLNVLDAQVGAGSARCAVRKDSGDDPDVTNGALIYAHVQKIPSGITIKGGEGVGRVTRPGLDQPVGAAAINSKPRQMIAQAVAEVCGQLGYSGGFSITIAIPGGEEIAKRTFNPRIGIIGGLSVIGTSGIVEPMSNQALIDTIRLELNQLAAANKHAVLFTPGNYGEAFIRNELGFIPAAHVFCSNFIGDAVDAAVELGFSRILLVGHIGKLVKLGIGAMNTHSSCGDGRMETLAACALAAGAHVPLLHAIMACATTDAALTLINDAELMQPTMQELGRRVEECLVRRVPRDVEIGYVLFTNAKGVAGTLSQSANAENLMKIWREEA